MSNTTPSTLENLTKQERELKAQHAAQIAKIEAERIRAAELQHPLGVALTAWRNLKDRILRAERTLVTYEEHSVKWREVVDAELDHPEDERGVNLWNKFGYYAAYSHADLIIVEINRYLKVRREQLSVLETDVKNLLRDGRGHLSHILPAELSHLAD